MCVMCQSGGVCVLLEEMYLMGRCVTDHRCVMGRMCQTGGMCVIGRKARWNDTRLFTSNQNTVSCVRCKDMCHMSRGSFVVSRIACWSGARHVCFWLKNLSQALSFNQNMVICARLEDVSCVRCVMCQMCRSERSGGLILTTLVSS